MHSLKCLNDKESEMIELIFEVIFHCYINFVRVKDRG